MAAAHSHENSRRNAHAVVRKKARTTLAVPSPPLRSQPHPAGHNPRRAAAACGLSPTGAVLAAHAPSQCGRATTFGSTKLRQQSSSPEAAASPLRRSLSRAIRQPIRITSNAHLRAARGKSS